MERHLGAGIALFAEPRIDLFDVELLAVGIEEDLDPPHLVRHLRHRVRALPLVVDVDLVAAVAAEHVGLGVHHRHEAHRHDQRDAEQRSEEHTSELQSLMRISYAVFCLKKKKLKNNNRNISNIIYA